MHTIARLTVFVRAICHTHIENLLKGPLLWLQTYRTDCFLHGSTEVSGLVLDSLVIYNNDIFERLLKTLRICCDPSSKQMLSVLIVIKSKAIMYPNVVASILFCIGLHHVTSNYIVHIVRAFKDKPLFLSFHNLFLFRLPFFILICNRAPIIM